MSRNARSRRAKDRREALLFAVRVALSRINARLAEEGAEVDSP